jgi:hypothetical protein
VVTLDPGESNFPWAAGWLEPSPEYAAVEPLFDEMNRVWNSDVHAERFGELHERVTQPGVHMRSLPDGAVSEVHGIRISGTKVRWR